MYCNCKIIFYENIFKKGKFNKTPIQLAIKYHNLNFLNQASKLTIKRRQNYKEIENILDIDPDASSLYKYVIKFYKT